MAKPSKATALILNGDKEGNCANEEERFIAKPAVVIFRNFLRSSSSLFFMGDLWCGRFERALEDGGEGRCLGPRPRVEGCIFPIKHCVKRTDDQASREEERDGVSPHRWKEARHDQGMTLLIIVMSASSVNGLMR